MAYPYTAIIAKKRIKVRGMNGDKFILDGGKLLVINPVEPETFKSVKLKKISKLTHTDGVWLLDGQDLRTRLIYAKENEGIGTVEGRTNEASDSRLETQLEALSSADRGKIKGVAFFDELCDEVEGETEKGCAVRQEFFDSTFGVGTHTVGPPLPPAKSFRPVLLIDFGIIGRQHEGNDQHARPLLPNVKPEQHQLAKANRSKPVARFVNDFQLAVIPPRSKGKELNLSIEAELRTLIKEIVTAGGSLSRTTAIQMFKTKHGKANSENYQPEKLLRSKIAKTLIKAGLLGTDKASRTSVFWAKVQAD